LLRLAVQHWLVLIPDGNATNDTLWHEVVTRVSKLAIGDAILCVRELVPLLLARGGAHTLSEVLQVLGIAPDIPPTLAGNSSTG
jgi:hypothetical protein